ncbi:Uncharacterised protein [Mycobacterium tuberculosis]|uniref:Uncharacterized protein n=1 Tax=Mycobacterium tuberculosis TaxID=1773 RepID=A0A0U0SLN0_MYCTX|nr:Uncharacterised protein [Mycobacterium tuberculosis]COX26217.1 Uncharacterised protein [Mycobacterium tuberculosis]
MRSWPLGPRQALSKPRVTPPASIEETVASIGMSVSGIDPPVHRRSEANISPCRNRCVGCCIHTSMVIAFQTVAARAATTRGDAADHRPARVLPGCCHPRMFAVGGRRDVLKRRTFGPSREKP